MLSDWWILTILIVLSMLWHEVGGIALRLGKRGWASVSRRRLVRCSTCAGRGWVHSASSWMCVPCKECGDEVYRLPSAELCRWGFHGIGYLPDDATPHQIDGTIPDGCKIRLGSGAVYGNFWALLWHGWPRRLDR